ncbi:MAG TPA: hypothetical protein P5107_10645 [Thermotogota bacterium]|nr:hypothetical protein [Thermotogota bacterium]HRW35501.1 hypothetical protein [Thermotogota bacterium]
MAKKSADPKKKKIIQIVLLLVLLAAFALLVIFVTLPAMGIELFGGKKTVQTAPRPVTTSAVTGGQPNQVVASTESSVDERYFEKLLENLTKEDNTAYYESEAFKPYIFAFENEEQVEDILMNSTNIMEFREGTFMSYFLTEDEEKTAWIKTSSEPNKVYELKINSIVPNVPYPLQVIEITQMGILLYRYPDEKEQEQKATPRLYRLLARPFIEIAELKTQIQ